MTIAFARIEISDFKQPRENVAAILVWACLLNVGYAA